MKFSQQLSLVDTMARMSLKADASRYFLGYVWWVLEPLCFVAVFYLVFDLLLNVGQGDFLVFLMCGKLSFVWFSKSVNQSARSIVASSGLIGRIDVPKWLFPMAVLQEGLYKQAAVFALLFAVVLLSGYPMHAGWLALLPLMAVNYLVIVACSLVGAFASCLLLDIAMLITLGTTFLLFTSGVFWNVRGLGDPALTDAVLMLNPLAFLVDGYRQVLMYNSTPDLMHLGALGAIFSVLILAIILLMRRFSQFLALRALTA